MSKLDTFKSVQVDAFESDIQLAAILITFGLCFFALALWLVKTEILEAK